MPKERELPSAMPGVRKFFSYDEDTDTMRIRTQQDVSAILDHNKAQQNEGLNKKSDYWHAAKIPNVIILEWREKFGVDLYDPEHSEAVKKLLNSNEYRYLRVKHFIM